MAINPAEIRPIELATDAIVTSRDSWLQIVFAGGIFVLLAQLIIYMTKMSGVEALAGLGAMTGSFAMFLSTVAVSLVTCARVLGVQIPYLPSALINEKQFWQYVWGALLVAFLAMLAMGACVGVGSFMVIGTGVSDTQNALRSLPLIISGLVGAVLWFGVYTRLFVLLPAVVVGEKVSPKASWKRTSGLAAFKIALAIVVSLGVFVIAEYMLKGAARYSGDPSLVVVLESLSVFFKLFRCAVEGALAGMVFLLIRRNEDENSDLDAAADIRLEA